MDNCSKHTKRGLPNTPRVSDKIMEYYQKFGHDRDLEKFMRLYSPASSQDSQKTQGGDCGASIESCCKRTKSRETISSTSSSCEALAMMPSRPLSVCGAINSKSLPNIDVQAQAIGGEAHLPSKAVVVDINIETEGDKEKIISISTENLHTPKKNFKNIKTQTPESIAKTHRRLEWDSLGDVGYIKSMSTSNISVMERSLLREFFKENSVVSEPGTSIAVKKVQELITEEHKTIKKLKATEIEHSTPPLACSTLVETTKRGAKPKMISQSTSSTSLNEKFEKYAQTSIIKPPTLHSQEIQCSMSSVNSIIEGTATPSSFEYCSSRSSKSRTSKSSDYVIKTDAQKHVNQSEHSFINSITELLMKRKALSEKNQQKRQQFNNIRELQSKFQTALDENKENLSHCSIDSTTTASSFSLSKKAPELDLGIQLICSLIDAKSVNGKQKKQLIRDIVKRITRLEVGDESSNSTTINSSGGTISSGCKQHHIYDSVRSSINKKHKQGNMTKLKEELGVTPITTEEDITKSVVEKPTTSTNSTSENTNKVLVIQPESNVKSKPASSPHFQLNHDKSYNSKQFPYKTKNQCENALKENNTQVPSVAAVAAIINKETQSEQTITSRSKERSKQIKSKHKHHPEAPAAPAAKESTTSIENKTSRSTQTSKTTISSSSATSATSTPDLTTQKLVIPTNNDLNNSNTDAEQPTMREWLNPLTQSEIEYEEKKRQEMKKKAQQEKLLRKSKNDSGRVQQLNWIESEIKRLESLKHLLLKDETNERSSTTVSSLDLTTHNNGNLTKDSTHTDKLYDTVYSDKSSVLSESAELLVQEIEIILEESHEDVINLKDSLKRSKDRKKEIQIMYEKGVDSSSNENCTKSKPKFRTLRECININEEQLLNVKEKGGSGKQRQQREKIDTPSTEKSQESESLRDLVQQRKRDFMAAYKTKKQHHYETLKQQQKEDFKYLNIQRQMHEKIATTTDSEHYSVPHTLPRKYVSNDVSYAYTQQPLPLTPNEREAKVKPHIPQRYNVIYSTAASGNLQNNQHLPSCVQTFNKETSNTTAANTNTTTTSSSSMFCMSSDVSVPMGSQNTSSTPTTTHQYDDVAAAATGVGVAVQTSDSILRSKPIYGPKRPSPITMPYNVASSTTTACIQVKPKGIAYIIEFSDNKAQTSNSTSNTDINSNDLHAKSNEIANNLPSEPQLTLQEHLEKSKPKFLQQSKERKAILNQLQAMRQERDRQLRDIIDNTSFNSLERRLQYLPPPPIQKVRILNTKEMKALTNKRFSSLPEVIARQERELEEKKRRGNRILRDVFNRRLQKRVRSGKLSLNHSRTVI
ncbi:kinesin-related protein 8-like [Lucilia sericata]|uniref:kinesin-related protein 8-like n=1 Tax=Lucilia sericata TaxID=13632 RepID=UPI0018A841FF|nr:kinesin-related protein 8-like [Lucilia sericata]